MQARGRFIQHSNPALTTVTPNQTNVYTNSSRRTRRYWGVRRSRLYLIHSISHPASPARWQTQGPSRRVLEDREDPGSMGEALGPPFLWHSSNYEDTKRQSQRLTRKHLTPTTRRPIRSSFLHRRVTR